MYNNIKINKNETAGQYVNSDKIAVLTMPISSSCFYVNYWSLVLSQLATISNFPLKIPPYGLRRKNDAAQ